MLPLIVIGADETVRGVLVEVAKTGTAPGLWHAHFFDTAEAAVFTLSLGQDLGPVEVEFEGESGWKVNVFYGPKALGDATIGKPQRLAHTGWTVVVSHGVLGNDPSRPRRVIAGIPEGEDQSSIVWQAAPMLRAHFLVDVGVRDEEGKPQDLLKVLDHLERHPQP